MVTVNSIECALGCMAGGPMVEVDEGVNASGALLVSCFPSVGFVSSIVAHYLVDKLELELVGAASSPVSSSFFAQELIITIMQNIMVDKKYVLLMLFPYLQVFSMIIKQAKNFN